MTTHATIQHVITTGREVATPESVGISQDAYDSLPTGRTFGQQGDVYFCKLAAVPNGARLLCHHDGQLVPGMSPGSRHCVDPVSVRLYERDEAGPLDGPIIEGLDARFTVTHPEHGDMTFPAHSIVGIVYQRAYADEIRRVID